MRKLMTLSSKREEQFLNYFRNYLAWGFQKDKNDFIFKFYNE